MADIIEALVKNVVNTQYENIPGSEVEATKRNILDTIGAAIAGSSEKGIKGLVELIKEKGGKKEATIWVYGSEVPVNEAAMAIGAMARCKELGNCHNRAGIHVSEAVIPAVFAMEEYTGGVSGKDFITAIAVGEDIACRLGLSSRYSQNQTGRQRLIRILGPAAACAKIRRLSEEKTYNALGIAYSRGTPIDMQQFADGSASTFLNYGFDADTAIRAVLLAEKGLSGTRNILQGKWGYYNVIETDYDLSPLTRNLGKRFEGAYSSIKPYPSCKCTHMAINATLDLVIEHDIKPDDVREIEIDVGESDYRQVLSPERYNPPNVISARFSIPYTVAVAVVERNVSLEDFTDEALERPITRELMKRIKGRLDSGLDSGIQSPAKVTIRTKDGEEYTKQRSNVRGDPEMPMTLKEIGEEKFLRFLPFSAKPIGGKNANAVIRLVGNLEEVNDVSRITRLIAPYT